MSASESPSPHYVQGRPAHGDSWANVTVGQTCVVENTPYTGYVDTAPTYTYVVSRDKWVIKTDVPSTLTDASVVVRMGCTATRPLCSASRVNSSAKNARETRSELVARPETHRQAERTRCISYNCESRGVCGRAADEPIHPATWVYALVGLGIFIRAYRFRLVAEMTC